MRRAGFAVFLMLTGSLIWSAFPPVSFAATMLCVSTPRANLRVGPGTNYRKSWEVNQFMPLEQLSRRGAWVRVRDVDGDIHWVHQRLVSTSQRCVTVSNDKANIRKKPSTRAAKWFTVERYTSFKRTGQQGQWVRLEYEGEVMWVFKNLV